MKAVLAFMGVLAIAGCAMEGKKSGTHQTAAKPAKAKPAPKPTLDDIAFSVAHAGAGPVNPANVYNNLFPINAGNSELIWRDPAKKQVLKVISVMSLKAYNSYYKGQKTTTSVIAGPPWVTAAPQLKRFCQGTGLKGAKVIDRIKEWLGLAPDRAYEMAVELWVDRDDLLRPCPDPEITDTKCEIAFEMRNGLPVNPPVSGFPVMTKDGHIPSYLAFFESIYKQQYAPGGDPWTRLGYTYDWNPATPIQGASEYILPPGKTAVIGDAFPLDRYCAG
jgi:hypothetical protein